MTDCDFDGNDSVDKCELHACLVMAENAHRADACPSYGALFCDCPWPTLVCEGAKNCDELEDETAVLLA